MRRFFKKGLEIFLKVFGKGLKKMNNPLPGWNQPLVTWGHGHLCSLTFQEKLTICLQLITHIRERVIEWAMAKWPGLGKSTVQKVLTAGASHWQDYVNGGHGNEYRLKSPTCYGEAMKSVGTKLRELHEKNFGITKVDVVSVGGEKLGLVSQQDVNSEEPDSFKRLGIPVTNVNTK